MYIVKGAPTDDALTLIMNNYKLYVNKNMNIDKIYKEYVDLFKSDLREALKQYIDKELT